MSREQETIIGRREFLRNSLATGAAMGCFSDLFKHAGDVAAQKLNSESRPTTHNMLVVGSQTTFLSHLPMFSFPGFDSPHNYQVILEATFTDKDRDLTRTYFDDRKKNSTEKMYTLNPAAFVLPQVDPKGLALKKFQGNAVFRGHLERGGESFIGDINGKSPFDVNVVNVIHFHKFDTTIKSRKLEYILFGKGQETFLAHLITAPPDFDQIISVKISGQSFTDDQLGRGMKVIIFPERANSAKKRLMENRSVGNRPVSGRLASGTNLRIEVLREFYFEEGELRTPPEFAPTPAEKAAGFP